MSGSSFTTLYWPWFLSVLLRWVRCEGATARLDLRRFPHRSDQIDIYRTAPSGSAFVCVLKNIAHFSNDWDERKLWRVFKMFLHCHKWNEGRVTSELTGFQMRIGNLAGARTRYRTSTITLQSSSQQMVSNHRPLTLWPLISLKKKSAVMLSLF